MDPNTRCPQQLRFRRRPHHPVEGASGHALLHHELHQVLQHVHRQYQPKLGDGSMCGDGRYGLLGLVTLLSMFNCAL